MFIGTITLATDICYCFMGSTGIGIASSLDESLLLGIYNGFKCMFFTCMMCLDHSFPLQQDIIPCITEEDSMFKKMYGECLWGRLTDDELIYSDRMVKAWTNFALYG